MQTLQRITTEALPDVNLVVPDTYIRNYIAIIQLGDIEEFRRTNITLRVQFLQGKHREVFQSISYVDLYAELMLFQESFEVVADELRSEINYGHIFHDSPRYTNKIINIGMMLHDEPPDFARAQLFWRSIATVAKKFVRLVLFLKIITSDDIQIGFQAYFASEGTEFLKTDLGELRLFTQFLIESDFFDD